MRHSHHAPGSPAAQAALASLAGWAPSRRGFIGSLLVTGAATTATAAGGAIFSPATAADAPGVSPRMAALIAEYARAWKVLEDAPDLAAETAASEAIDQAEQALMAERPAHMVDFAAKFHALTAVDDSESDASILKHLGADADFLAGAK